MKTASKIYAGIATSLLLVASACTNDLTDEPNAPTTGGDSKLKLELSLDGTRSYTDKTSFTEGDEILVAVSFQGDVRETCKATYSSGDWILDGDGIDLNHINDIKDTDFLSVYAYYPYSVAINEHSGSDPYLNIDNALNQTDYIAGHVTDVSISNPIAKIKMNHAMARLSLNVTNPFDEDIIISSVTLSCYTDSLDNYAWIYQKGRLYFADDYSYTIQSGNEIPDPYIIDVDTKIEQGNSKSIDLLVPSNARAYSMWSSSSDKSNKTGVKFDLLINGKTYSFKTTPTYWMEGTRYTYNVTLKQAEQEPTTGEIAGHEWVDLGLSVRWATCNIGATTPEEYGDYFAWGETSPKSSYTIGNSITYGKTVEELQSEGIINLDGILTKEYDAAYVIWESSWRMPTYSEFEELSQCDWKWTNQDGVNGYNVTGPNGNSIFLPATGSIGPTGIWYLNESGFYYSSSVIDKNDTAWEFFMGMDEQHYLNGGYRNVGCAVRPIADK